MTPTDDRLPDAVRWLLSGRDDTPSGRCGCTGQCGRRHPSGLCDASERAGLTVAPADLSIQLTQAAALPADQLIVWCPTCRRLGEGTARRRRQDQAEQELAATQLRLWGAP
ncbi:MAG: hypothetical protein ACRDPQ_15725 [Nocardioidaceae bacterium]